MAKRTVQCAQCGSDVDSIGVGRPRKYCDQCRPRTYKPKSHTTVKQCPNCDTQFETPNRERIYCSRACAAAVRMTAKRTPREPHAKTDCSEDECDREVHAKGLCRSHYNRRQHEQSHAREVAARNPIACPVCGARFTPEAGRKYCSIPCQRRALVDHGPATCTEEGCARAARARGLCMKHLKRLYVKEGRIAPEPWDDRRRANYQARRARKAGATTGTPVVSAEVYKRDNWTCQLCGDPVAREVRWPDPMSPSLDHRVPLAKGGEHSMDNVQLAHLHCNVSKGARVEQATVVA